MILLHKFFLILLFIFACQQQVFGSDAGNTEATSVDQLLQFDSANLGLNCGQLSVGWMNALDAYAPITKEKMSDSDILSFLINSAYPELSWKLTINTPGNIIIESFSDDRKAYSYRESWEKSMPPGPGSEAGFRSRYTLLIMTKSNIVESLELTLEDFDPRSKDWYEYFDIRVNRSSQVLCYK